MSSITFTADNEQLSEFSAWDLDEPDEYNDFEEND